MSNQTGIGEKLKSYLKHPGSFIVMLLVMLGAIITFAVLLFLIAYILINGVPHIKPSLFAFEYTSENASLMPALINTIIMTLLFFADRGSVWNLLCDLPCRVCRERE